MEHTVNMLNTPHHLFIIQYHEAGRAVAYKTRSVRGTAPVGTLSMFVYFLLYTTYLHVRNLVKIDYLFILYLLHKI